jgi:hypothetical protein
MRLTVRHLLVTAVAAPVNFSRRTHSGDPAALARVLQLRAADHPHAQTPSGDRALTMV